MKNYIFLIIFFISVSCCGQSISICSWNLKDFGKSKSDSEVYFIANIVKRFDIIAVQEVVSGPAGSKAVARLADQLNRMGSKWDYVISQPTSGSSMSAERYAFLWQTSKVKKRGDPWLSTDYALEIDREPFFCRFSARDKLFTIVNYHSISKSKHPETEVKYFKFFPGLYPKDNLIFCGDFNLPQSHSVFNPLRKLGYRPILVGRKTTLRQKCIQQDCLASEFDNIFCHADRVKILKKGFIEFFHAFDNIKSARLISDHIPIFAEIE
jgi:endonuclease/exonuclease/phosphatase family metal-dependent hydrolase